MRIGRAIGAVAVAVALAGCADPVPVIVLEAQPSPSPSPSPTPTEASPTPTESSPSPSDTPSATEETPRAATDTDRARFVAAYQPENASGLQHVATDLDGDRTQEVLFAYLRGGRVTHVDVAWWTGTEYEIVFADDGGEATRIASLRAADVNGDGRNEIVIAQTGGTGATMTLWQVAGPRQVVALRASGGCHDGSNTYGHDGVSFEDRDADGVDEIHASCPDGSTDRYRWEAGAYRHAPSLMQ